MKHIFSACLLGSLAAWSAPVMGQAKLEWKLLNGDRFYLEIVHRTRQTTKIPSGDVKLDLVEEKEATAVEKVEVLECSADRVVIKLTLLSLSEKSTVEGTQDNAKAAKDLDEISQELSRRLKGVSWTVTCSPDLRKLVKVHGLDEFIKNAFKDDELRQKSVVASRGDEAFKHEFENTFLAFLPESAVGKGTTWRRQGTLPLGPMGGFQAEGTYQYRGTEKVDNQTLEGIDVSWKLKYVLPRNQNGLPFQIVDAELNTDHASGRIYFDGSKGRLSRVDQKVQFHGHLDVNVGGAPLRMELVQLQDWRIRVSETPPSAK